MVTLFIYTIDIVQPLCYRHEGLLKSCGFILLIENYLFYFILSRHHIEDKCVGYLILFTFTFNFQFDYILSITFFYLKIISSHCFNASFVHLNSSFTHNHVVPNLYIWHIDFCCLSLFLLSSLVFHARLNVALFGMTSGWVYEEVQQ